LIAQQAEKDRKIRAGKRDFIFLPLCSCLLSVGGLRISFGRFKRRSKVHRSAGRERQKDKGRKKGLHFLPLCSCLLSVGRLRISFRLIQAEVEGRWPSRQRKTER
jgi:hypothetical protein